MAKTPLLRMLRTLSREHRLCRQSGKSLAQHREERAHLPEQRRSSGGPSGLSRRGFLSGGSVALAGAMLSCGRRTRPSPGQPRIAIVGAGLAGLTAAVQLVDQGLIPTVYEYDPHRVGGRMMTWRGLEPGLASACDLGFAFDDGQYADLMGELIDSDHQTMLGLIQRFGLSTVDLIAAQPDAATDTYFFQGGYYPRDEVEADYARLLPWLEEDVAAAGYPTTYEQSTPTGRELSNMSVYEWIETRVPGGHGSRFGTLLDVAYTIEYGAPTTEQSALNLLYLLGYAGQTFSIFGESDERYSIAGGVDLLPRLMGESLGIGETVRLGWRMEALTQLSDGSYALDFEVSGGGHQVVRADLVLLALPFAVLRLLDLSRAGFDALKLRAIHELGAARNGKLFLQFTRRLWREPGPWGLSTGSSFSDTGYQNTWEGSRGQPGTSGLLVNYTGGEVAESLALAHLCGDSRRLDLRRDAEDFLQRVEPVYPGLQALWNGKAVGTRADLSPRFNCSYSYWKPGQPHTFGGYERVRQGNVLFAGEHTSVDFQGWMEGAAAEGMRAASDLLQALEAYRSGPERLRASGSAPGLPSRSHL